MENKFTKKELVYFLIISAYAFFIIGVLLGVVIGMTPAKKCLENPLNYGIEGLQQGELKAVCYCNYNDFTFQGFFFNETGVYPLNARN